MAVVSVHSRAKQREKTRTKTKSKSKPGRESQRVCDFPFDLAPKCESVGEQSAARWGQLQASGHTGNNMRTGLVSTLILQGDS